MNGELPAREFGAIAIRDAMVSDVTHIDQLQPIGCVAALREARPLPDGRYDIITTGARRYRLLELDTTAAPYLVGRVEWVPDQPLTEGSENTVTALEAVARAAHERYCESAWAEDDWHAPPEGTPPELLSYILASDCLLPMSDRQALLSEPNVLARLRMACQLLTREAGFLAALRAVPASHTELDFSKPSNLN